MALFSQADFPQVRAAIDVSLTDQDLPDSVIGSDIYQGAAELEVLGLFDGAQAAVLDTSSANALRVKLAAILYTAALLCEAVPALTQERILSGDYWYQRTARDCEAQAAVLRGRAATYLRQATGDTSLGWMFGRVSRSHGWPAVGLL